MSNIQANPLTFAQTIDFQLCSYCEKINEDWCFIALLLGRKVMLLLKWPTVSV